MQSKQSWNPEQLERSVAELAKNRDAVARLAQSGEAQRMLELLQQRNGGTQAVKAAAQGDVSQLMGIMNQFMNSEEGASLIRRIQDQARQEGLN